MRRLQPATQSSSESSSSIREFLLLVVGASASDTDDAWYFRLARGPGSRTSRDGLVSDWPEASTCGTTFREPSLLVNAAAPADAATCAAAPAVVFLGRAGWSSL